jgi:hypothetical protein
VLKEVSNIGSSHYPKQLTEMLGAVGLIMIVLEAGLDLKMGREKILLIRSSFFAALFIFILIAGRYRCGIILLYCVNLYSIALCMVYHFLS